MDRCNQILESKFMRKTWSLHSSIKRACIIAPKSTEKELNLVVLKCSLLNSIIERGKVGKKYLNLMAHENVN